MNTFRITFRYKYASSVPNDPHDGKIVSNTMDIGQIQSISYSYNINNTSAGIPSQPAQNAFIMDHGVTRTHRFSYRRITPDDPVDTLGAFDGSGNWVPADSTKWSNGFWVFVMKRYIVNRWQAETDGCKISYIVPEEDSHLYNSIPETNVYVNAFSVEETAGDIQTLNGNISFIVGATNLTKVVAKHTIVYDANYDAYSPNANDPTNYVVVTNTDSASAITLPDIWRSRAIGVYGISVDDDKFVWCSDPVPQYEGGELKSKAYEQGDLITFDSDKKGDILTLYAIYGGLPS